VVQGTYPPFWHVARRKLILVYRTTNQQSNHLPTYTSQNDRRMKSPYPVFSMFNPETVTLFAPIKIFSSL
jgi:hypothetical protein